MAVVAESPLLWTGFTTLARNVASQLAARGCAVSYVAVGADPAPPGLPFTVHPAADAREAAHCLARLGAAQLSVVVFGRGTSAVELSAEATRIGIRDRIDLVAYVAADYAPLPRLDAFAAALDRIVPATEFAYGVLEQAGPARPIPHGVDVDVFRPLPASDRATVRRRRFDVGDSDLLVGYFGRNSGHKRSDLSLRAFAHVALGTYARCRRCAGLTTAELDPVALETMPITSCRHCGGGDLDTGAPQPGARLYMHTELLSRDELASTGGWDLQGLAGRLGVASQVLFDRSVGTGRSLEAEELARRMAACDVHVLLYECGGWELTVLETGACGVPNVITDIAAPPEYAAPFSRLVPVATHVVGVAGHRGLADLDAACAAVLELGASPGERARLGARGVEVAAAHDWERVGELWLELLRAGDA